MTALGILLQMQKVAQFVEQRTTDVFRKASFPEDVTQ
jgi:hypothetical protein